LKVNKSEKTKSNTQPYHDLEWERIKHLIPEVINHNKKADIIERDILNSVDGKSTCEEIVKSQETVSEDGAVFMLLKFEMEGTIRCIGAAEKIRGAMFECTEAEKYLEFVRLEKKRLLNEISEKKEQVHNENTRNGELKSETASLQKKTRLAKRDLDKLQKKHEEAVDSVNCLIGARMGALDRCKDVEKAIRLFKEEIIYLNDERSAAIKRIKEIENKIDEVFNLNESVSPKMSIYRGVVRETYKTIRDARTRSEYALKGV